MDNAADPSEAAGCACALCDGARSGDVRLVRRLVEPVYAPVVEAEGTRLGMVLDVETTGLRPEGGEDGSMPDEIIELAAVPFTYDVVTGTILAVHAPFSGLRQPSRPIPPEVSRLTGLDDARVEGRVIARQDVERVVPLDRVALVIAHNAGFDRRFVEGYAPLGEVFVAKPWACTVEDVDWRGAGIASAKLEFVAAMAFGLFYPAHRALDDCLALVEILGRDLPTPAVDRIGSGAPRTVLRAVLDSARKGRHRIRSSGPFATKDTLKSRGYRWDPGAPGRGKAWCLQVVGADAAKEECEFLRSIGCSGSVKPLSAFDRFSSRA